MTVRAVVVILLASAGVVLGVPPLHADPEDAGSDGASAGGRSATERESGADASEGKSPESKSPESKPPQGKPSEGEPPQGKPSEGKSPDGRPSEGEPPQGEATEGSAPEDPKAAQKARRHFRRGMERFRAHAYREAIRHFTLAAELVPSADLWFNIARAHEELSEYEQAIEYYRKYLRDRVDPPDRKEIEQHIEDLKQRAEARRKARQRRPDTGTLRVHSNLKGATVQLGDRDLGQAPVSVPLNLKPGEHTVRVEREDRIPFRAQVDVERGETTGAYAELPPKTRYRSVRGDRLWTWIVGGVAGASLLTSLGLGIHAKMRNADGARNDAREWGLYSDIALGTGLALGVGAAVLWFVEGRAVETREITQEASSPGSAQGPAKTP